jgi:hypothetical protein
VNRSVLTATNVSTAEQVLGARVARGVMSVLYRYVAVQAPPGLAATKPLAEVELAEEDHGGSDPLGQLEGLAPPTRVENVEAVVAELPAEVLPGLDLGLGDEDGARHDPTLAVTNPAHQMSLAPNT